MGYSNPNLGVAPENGPNKPDTVVLNKDKETWIISEGTACNTGCIHERTLCKQQKYTELKSGLKTLYPNHKVRQVNILLDFLGGYDKQQLDAIIIRGTGKSRLKYYMQRT